MADEIKHRDERVREERERLEAATTRVLDLSLRAHGLRTADPRDALYALIEAAWEAVEVAEGVAARPQYEAAAEDLRRRIASGERMILDRRTVGLPRGVFREVTI